MMQNTNPIKLLICCMLPLFIMGTLASADFSYGARAAAMGGAYVALANDASAIYWNPAAAAVITTWSVGLEYGSELEVAEDAQKVFDRFVGMDPGAISEGELSAFLKGVEGFQWMARGGDRAGFAIANLKTSLTLNSYQLFYVEPDIDNDVPLNSQWRLTGVEVKEYGLNYAWMNQAQSFSLGFNAKYVDLKGYNSSVGMWDMDSYDAGDMLDLVEDGISTDESDWNIDAGLLFFSARSRVGITAKNLNKLNIEFEDGTKFQIKPEYRIGYAFIPSNRFTYSLDYAITKNRNVLGESMDGSEVAMGFEGIFGKTGWLILRGGGSMELSGDAPLMLSGGIGLKFTNVILDFAYVTDPEQDTDKLWGGIRIFFKEARRR